MKGETDIKSDIKSETLTFDLILLGEFLSHFTE